MKREVVPVGLDANECMVQATYPSTQSNGEAFCSRYKPPGKSTLVAPVHSQIYDSSTKQIYGSVNFCVWFCV